MAYSRWGNGNSEHWYTYWCVQPNGTEETKDNAIFEICGVCSFTAKQLKNDIKKCIDTVASKDITANKKLLKELKIYMNEFLFDIEKEYTK